VRVLRRSHHFESRWCPLSVTNGLQGSITARWHPNAAKRSASASSIPRYGRAAARGVEESWGAPHQHVILSCRACQFLPRPKATRGKACASGCDHYVTKPYSPIHNFTTRPNVCGRRRADMDSAIHEEGPAHIRTSSLKIIPAQIDALVSAQHAKAQHSTLHRDDHSGHRGDGTCARAFPSACRSGRAA
jgi:hypothetical protein